jgi:hypothetical protein
MGPGVFGGSEAVVEGLGFGGGFDGEFLGEVAAAGFELGEGGAALAGFGEEGHHEAVDFFAPGFEGEEAAGVVYGGGVFGLVGLLFGQGEQGLNGEVAEVVALVKHPVFKVKGVAEAKAFEEVAAIEFDGLAEES